MAEIIIADDTPREQYAVGATPTTGPFSIPWPFYADSDIVVYVDNTLQTITTDYTVSGTAVDDGFSSGSITFTSSQSNVTVTVFRDIPIERTTDFPTAGVFNIKTLNKNLDQLFAIGQQLEDRYTRSAHITADDDYNGGEVHLPKKSTRSSKVLAFDANGDFTTSTETLTSIEGGVTASAASAAAAALSEANAASSEAAASISETNAAASEAAAAASAQGWSDVVQVTTGTTNIEITDARKYYILDASGGAITINMPAVGDVNGMTYGFEVLDATNAITIVRDGTDTINGVAGNYTSLTGVGDVVHFISIDGAPDDWSARLISRFVVDDTTIAQTGRTIGVKALGVDTAQLAADAVDGTKIANDSVGVEHVTGTVNTQTGTTYTFVVGDAFKTVTASNAAAVTFTVPTFASAAFSVGDRIDNVGIGAGLLTITGATGVTINGVSAGSGTLSAQYSAASLLNTATDTWLLIGDHGGVA